MLKLYMITYNKKGETNIVNLGISLGASTITKAIYDYNLQPSKIILEMPFW